MGHDPASADTPRIPPYEWFVLLAPVVAVYAATLCPTVHWYDSAEFAAKAATLGVPHPPGYPLYTLLAHLFTWLPFEPAFSVNLMSLVFAAIAIAVLHALARGLGLTPAAAWISGWILAFAPTMWANAIVTEVYTPGLACTLGVFLILQRGERRAPSLRPVFWAALLAGAGVGMHMSIATLGLGYAFVVLTWGVPLQRLADLRRCLAAPWAPRVRTAAVALGGALLGLAVFLYVPWRRSDSLDDPTTWTAVLDSFLGGSFKYRFLDDYDVGERLALIRGVLADNLRAAGILAALLGLAALTDRAPRWGLACGLAMVGNVWWFFNYNVPDLDVFLLPTLALAALAIGAGLQWAASRLATRWRWGHLVVWVGLAWPARSVPHHWRQLDMSDSTEARVWGEAACDALPGNALVFHSGDPGDWRMYAVLEYMRSALGRCAGVQILRRPDPQVVRRALRDGRPVYAFTQTRHLELSYRYFQQGPMIRVIGVLR